jgi:hypothetical protein
MPSRINQSVPSKKNARRAASGPAVPQSLKRRVNRSTIQKRKMAKEITLGTARGPAAPHHVQRRDLRWQFRRSTWKHKVRPRP